MRIEVGQVWRAVDKRRLARVMAVDDGWISLQTCDEAGTVIAGKPVRRAAYYRFAMEGQRSGADYLPHGVVVA
jgi:hypothetical protein